MVNRYLRAGRNKPKRQNKTNSAKNTEAIMIMNEAIAELDRSIIGLPVVTSPSAPLALQAFASIKHWPRDRDIVVQDEVSDDWYCVVSGAARQCIIRADGRRQIVDILLPGDFFGFSPTGKHRFAVQAVADDTIVASYSKRRVEALADANPQIGREIRDRMNGTISRLQEQLLMVGTITATEKVRAFLFHMFERMPGVGGHSITLPVSRYDIADQLGISVETVSRSVTELKTSGIIQLVGPRKVQMLTRDCG
jgi:CRP/FNR family nitrogen fixation transcriptional regulator